MTEAVVKQGSRGMALEAPQSLDAIKDQVASMHKIMKEMMEEDLDGHYGVIPGTKKKTLFKPGAEKLCFAFRLRPEYELQRTTLPNDHCEYTVKCTLFSMKTGEIVGQGVGSASTMESKHRYRNAAKSCPECNGEFIIKGKEEYGGGWLCWKKNGGCGAKFLDGDKRVEDQPTGKVEIDDIADKYNPILKVSKKRSFVDATITALAASDLLMQDVGDPETENFVVAEPAIHEAVASVTFPEPTSAPVEHTPVPESVPMTKPAVEAVTKALGGEFVSEAANPAPLPECGKYDPNGEFAVRVYSTMGQHDQVWKGQYANGETLKDVLKDKDRYYGFWWGKGDWKGKTWDYGFCWFKDKLNHEQAVACASWVLSLRDPYAAGRKLGEAGNCMVRIYRGDACQAEYPEIDPPADTMPMDEGAPF